MFAKILKSEKFGQILVMKQDNDDGDPEIRFFFQPEHEELGVCSTAYAFNDTDDRDSSFDKIDIQKAESVVGKVVKIINGEI